MAISKRFGKAPFGFGPKAPAQRMGFRGAASQVAKVGKELREFGTGLKELEQRVIESKMDPQERAMRKYHEEVREMVKLREFESNMKMGSKERYATPQEKKLLSQASERIRQMLASLHMNTHSRMSALLEKELIEKLGLEAILQVEPQELHKAFHSSANLNYIINELNNNRGVHPRVMEKAIEEITTKLEEGQQ
ncbi:MAG: hypothetical protein WCW13_05570 [archaeon]|jgi:signal transduction histidine kinase